MPDYPERPECDFSLDYLDGQTEPPKAHCDNCGNYVILKDALSVVKRPGDHSPELVYVFCDELCGNTFFLERLRSGGL